MDATTTDKPPEPRPSTRLMDTLIRVGLLVALAMLCYRIFAPFLTLMVWAVILAITMYPLHQALAARIGGRQGLSSTLLVLIAFVVLIVPTGVLMSSLGDSVHQLVSKVQDHSVEVPRPPDFIAGWPFVGEKIHGTWTRAHDDPRAFLESLQPKIGELAKTVLGFVGGIATGLLQFLGALITAGIIMAYGQSGGTSSTAIFERVVGGGRGAEFTRLCTATIRAVAQGVIGVAFIQAIVVGLSLLIAGVPWAGVLALVVLVLAIAQVPAFIVTLPAIAWIWMRADYGTLEASLYTALILVSGLADNVLKPLMLGRGVDAPMPVILIGALGGMAAAGILGMFVGAVLLALGYQIFMGWVAANREVVVPE